MTHREFIETLADLMNLDPDPARRGERLRDANWKLFAECVGGTKAQAKLALAEAAAQRDEEFRRRPKRVAVAKAKT